MNEVATRPVRSANLASVDRIRTSRLKSLNPSMDLVKTPSKYFCFKIGIGKS